MRQFNLSIEKPKQQRAGATLPAPSNAPRVNVAPPVYRPSNNPASLQRKPAAGAPPVYNPLAKASRLAKSQGRIVSPEQGLTALCVRGARTPAVSRHTPGGLPVQRQAGAIPLPVRVPANRPPTGRAQATVAFAPHVYRPLANSGTAQTKIGTLTPRPAQQNRLPGRSIQPGSTRQPALATRTVANMQLQPAGVVQRLVDLLSEDDMTRGTYRHLTQTDPGATDPTGSLRAIPDLNHPYATLGRNESLHIIVHGGGGTVIGMDPEQFAAFLERRGLDPDKHRGVIRLVSCFSGTPDVNGNTFVQQFAGVMRRRGFTNQIIGFNGLVRATSGAQILVVPPDKAAEFFKLSRMKTLLETQLRQAQQRKPTASSTQEQVTEFLVSTQELLAKYKLITEKLSKLWVPQNLQTNIVVIPEAKEYMGEIPVADSYTRRHADEAWEDWMRQQMQRFNMLGPGQSARPLHDYSASYIS
jgi:hypothetical protein